MSSDAATHTPTRPGTADDLERLRHERESAHRAYNDALTALDAAIRTLRDLPAPPAPYDPSRLAALNEQWDLSKTLTGSKGSFGRLRAFASKLLAPLIGRQQAFNAAVVDHINRNAASHRETAAATAAALAMYRDELEALSTFQTKLILFAQQITPYVDTKDRYVEALPNALAAGLSGLSDDIQKRWESMMARERRYEARVNDVQGTLGVLQRAVLTVKRELEQRPALASPGAPATAPALPAGPAPASPPALAAGSTASSRPLDSYKYVGFEDEFRGSQRDIRERMTGYVADFAGSQDVLDIGCGRGEFLDLLRAGGIAARGIDINDEMAAVCRDRGLDAAAGDALTYLLAQPDGSLGGLFAAQVVEHLEPDYLMRLLEAAYHKLRPGSKIILETINAACWYAFFSSYIRDVTHVRPLHPDTLRYLLVASGFQQVEVRYSAPFPDESKLQPMPSNRGTVATSSGASDEPPAAMTAVFNENVAKLNDLLFTYLDYAVIGVKL